MDLRVQMLTLEPKEIHIRAGRANRHRLVIVEAWKGHV